MALRRSLIQIKVVSDTKLAPCGFTSEAFTSILIERGVKISMDGKGRYLDNIFVERLWRSIKYEEIYLKGYANGIEAAEGIRQYFQFFNEERLHQSLRYQTPKAVWEAGSLRLHLESLATCCQSKKEVILWEK